MSAAALLQEIERAGGQVRADHDKLKLSAPAPLPDDLVVEIKAHKAELLAALKDDANARRRTLGGGDLVDNVIDFAVAGLPITAEAVRKALSPEDILDIEVGDLGVENVRCFARCIIEREGGK